MTNSIILALLLALQPQPQRPLSEGGYAAQGGDASLSCEQLAAELMVSVGGVMGNAGEQVRIAQSQPDIMAGPANQVLGMAAAALPNFVHGIIGAVEQQRQERLAREAQSAAAREQVLMVEQQVRLDRLQRLHEMHQQRCAGQQAR